LRVADVGDARQLLERDRRKVQVAISALVIGVTSFFRDDHVFNDIATTVLPALPKPPNRCRIWSVGCSDGEELYSVAMLLSEAGLLASADVLGTDCRASAVAHARDGLYDATALTRIPRQWWEKYFVHEGARLRVAPQLRSAVHWRVADASQICEPGAWDVVLCRNMAMYMRANVAAALWRRFEAALRPGGFLILGKAERPIGTQRLSPLASCIYRRDQG
jgi:chemotaxis methyl-accepting protein methylase